MAIRTTAVATDTAAPAEHRFAAAEVDSSVAADTQEADHSRAHNLRHQKGRLLVSADATILVEVVASPFVVVAG